MRYRLVYWRIKSDKKVFSCYGTGEAKRYFLKLYFIRILGITKMKRGLIRPRGKGWEGVVSSYKATKNKNRFAIKRAISPWIFLRVFASVFTYLCRVFVAKNCARELCDVLSATPCVALQFCFHSFAPPLWKRDACYAFALTIYFYVKAIERRNTGPVILAAFLGSLAARRDSRVIKRSLGGKEWIRAAQEVAGRKSTGEASVVQKT